MHADERQRRIVEQARRGGRVEVSRLALELDVTQETIRRDLTNLERLGEVKRVHGGAVPLDRLGLGLEPRLEDRESRMAAEKDRIAKLALDELPESGSIIVDAGTTTARFVAHLPADRELTVVINGLDIAATLSRMPKLKVLLVGGQVRARTLAVVDTWGNGLLNDLYVDVAFIGTDGISAQRGLTTPDAAEATAKRAMISAARDGRCCSRTTPRSARSTSCASLTSRTSTPSSATAGWIPSCRSTCRPAAREWPPHDGRPDAAPRRAGATHHHRGQPMS